MTGKMPPRVRGYLEPDPTYKWLVDFCPEQWELAPFRHPLGRNEVEYLSFQEHTALLQEERARAFEEAAEAVDRKLQSLMAGNYSVLVDSYRSQIGEVFTRLAEAARKVAPGGENG